MWKGIWRDENLLKDIFATNNFEAVFHMAASLEVEESVREPAKYLENNLVNIIKLLRGNGRGSGKENYFFIHRGRLGRAGVVPVKETAPLRPKNPYGASKLLVERVIKYFCEYLGISSGCF